MLETNMLVFCLKMMLHGATQFVEVQHASLIFTIWMHTTILQVFGILLVEEENGI